MNEPSESKSGAAPAHRFLPHHSAHDPGPERPRARRARAARRARRGPRAATRAAPRAGADGPSKPKVERKDDGKIPSFVPRTGLVYSEKTNLSEVLCKPKIMPIRPQHLVRKEQAELDAESDAEDDAGDDAAEAKQ